IEFSSFGIKTSEYDQIADSPLRWPHLRGGRSRLIESRLEGGQLVLFSSRSSQRGRSSRQAGRPTRPRFSIHLAAPFPRRPTRSLAPRNIASPEKTDRDSRPKSRPLGTDPSRTAPKDGTLAPSTRELGSKRRRQPPDRTESTALGGRVSDGAAQG